MSIEESEIAIGQSNVYASAYMLLTTPTIPDDDERNNTVFVSQNGTTTWPCMARRFDDAASAFAAKIALGLPDAKVVKVSLQYVAEVAEAIETTPNGIPTITLVA